MVEHQLVYNIFYNKADRDVLPMLSHTASCSLNTISSSFYFNRLAKLSWWREGARAPLTLEQTPKYILGDVINCIKDLYSLIEQSDTLIEQLSIHIGQFKYLTHMKSKSTKIYSHAIFWGPKFFLHLQVVVFFCRPSCDHENYDPNLQKICWRNNASLLHDVSWVLQHKVKLYW